MQFPQLIQGHDGMVPYLAGQWWPMGNDHFIATLLFPVNQVLLCTAYYLPSRDAFILNINLSHGISSKAFESWNVPHLLVLPYLFYALHLHKASNRFVKHDFPFINWSWLCPIQLMFSKCCVITSSLTDRMFGGGGGECWGHAVLPCRINVYTQSWYNVAESVTLQSEWAHSPDFFHDQMLIQQSMSQESQIKLHKIYTFCAIPPAPKPQTEQITVVVQEWQNLCRAWNVAPGSPTDTEGGVGGCSLVASSSL